MKIIGIREMDVPLTATFSNAVVNFEGHRSSLVAVFAQVSASGGRIRRLAGVAFNSIGRHSQGGILRDRMIPRVLAAPADDLIEPTTGIIDPARVLRTAMQGEKPGGHGDRASAAAAIELACWDLLAKYNDEPAYRTISRAFGTEPLTGGAPVYAAGGYYKPGDDLGQLADELTDYLDTGYEAVKIKIGGLPLVDDMRRVEAALRVTGTGERLAVDANGRFDGPESISYAQALAPYGLRWFEEPVDPLAYGLHSELTALYEGPLATGENLFSVRDVENLMAFGGLRADRDILQMDAGLSYGLTEYMSMLERLDAHGFSRRSAMPHGGHLINLHIVVGLGLGGCEAYPGVFEPFGGYSDDCVLADGLIRPADRPGFGLEAKAGLVDYIERLTS